MKKLSFSLILLFSGLLIINTSKAQGPLSQEYLSFESAGTQNSVNQATGDYSKTIPLLTLPGVEGGYPIALSYHAGVKVNQEASWVGLGWNVNVGAITRQVNGYPDDYKKKNTLKLTNRDADFEKRYAYGAGSPNQPSFNFFSSQMGSSPNHSVSFVLNNKYLQNLNSTQKDIFNNFLNISGPLYFKDAQDLINTTDKEQKVNQIMDTYQIVTKDYPNAPLEKDREGNGRLPNYDQYMVACEGLGGIMQPKILENGSLVGQGYEVFNPFNKLVTRYTNNQFNAFTKNQQDIHFYFQGQSSGFGEVTTPSFTSTPTSAAINASISGASFNANTGSESFYNSSTKQLGQSKHIRHYTNNEMHTSQLSLAAEGIMEYQPIKGARSNQTYFDPTGIGGYSITDENGITYHFALPVYQFERVDILEDLGSPSVDFIEEIDLNKHAVHWLLTGITGPSFVDKGTIGIIDDQDLGYWVKFSYGKWSDGYFWRTPQGDDEYETPRGTNAFQYSFGRKQIYYLNSAETKTHVAYFIKDKRKDNISRNITTNQREVSDAHTSIALLKGGIGTHKTGGNHKTQYKMNYPVVHEQLRLSRILLFKKGNVPAFSKARANNSIQKGTGSFTFYRNTILNGGGIDNDLDQISTFDYHLHENVLDENDIMFFEPKIKTMVLKEINFDTDYSLCENFPGSYGKTGLKKFYGKLSLRKLTTKVSNGVKTPTQLSFNYYNLPSQYYFFSDKDDWGNYFGGTTMIEQFVNKDLSHLDKSKIDSWNLKEVIHSSGKKEVIEYECDEYFRESANRYDEFTVASFRLVNDKTIELTFSSTVSVNNFKSPNGSNGTYKLSLEFVNQITSSCTLNKPVEVMAKFLSENNGVYTFEEAIPYNSSSKLKPLYDGFPIYFNGPIVCNHANLWISPNSNSSFFILGEGVGSFKGGGLRVKQIEVMDTKTGSKMKDVYEYSFNGTTTGTTTYAPRSVNRVIPYITELPGPQVIYSRVKKSSYGSNNEKLNHTMSRFETSSLVYDSYGYRVDPVLYVSRQDVSKSTNNGTGYFIPVSGQPPQFVPYKDYFNYDKISIDKVVGALGRPKSMQMFNAQDELISSTTYTYRSKGNIGEIQETFNTCDRLKVVHDPSSQNKYENFSNLIFCTKSERVHFLTDIVQTALGSSKITKFESFDLITGNATQIKTKNSTGQWLSTTSVPAFKLKDSFGNVLYPNIEPKVYASVATKKLNILNIGGTSKSFLNSDLVSSTAVSYTDNFAIRGFNSTTNKFENTSYNGSNLVTKQSHVFNGVLSERGDGSINTTGAANSKGKYTDISWPGSPPVDWQGSTVNTLYDEYLRPLESKSINGTYSCSKIGYNKEHKIASCSGAKYTECTYSGAEDLETGKSYFLSELKLVNASVVGQTVGRKAHTGNKMFEISAHGNGLKYEFANGSDLELSKKYVVTVWVHKPSVNYSGGNPRLFYTNNQNVISIIDFESNEVSFGDWIRMECIFETNSVVENGQSVYIDCANCEENFYFDDFRLQPIGSTMKSFVFDHVTNRITAELDANNIGIKYYYDDIGRLIRTDKEIAGTATTGGFVISSETRFNSAK